MLDTTTPIPTQPLHRIALTFSGGGYRAAAFHLGTLDYLNHLQFQGAPLLHKVKVISTVSGGTITGALYGVMLQQGKSFQEFFDRLKSFMDKFDLIESGLQLLNDDEHWDTHKRRNLINAFAQIYDRELLNGATFRSFDDLFENGNHLEEVIFNATEFEHGLYFRFQNRGLLGNYYLRLEKEERAKINEELKIGDIVAASSCFPAGFEPITFPHDFRHTQAFCLSEKVKNGDCGPRGIGLMDGGIVDNQGIYSVIRSEDRRTNAREKQQAVGDASADDFIIPNVEEKQIDLLFISDVSSPFMQKLEYSEFSPNSTLEGLSIGSIRKRIRQLEEGLRWGSWLILVFALAFILALLGVLSLPGWSIGLLGLVFGLLIIPMLFGRWIKHWIRKLLSLKEGKKIDSLVPEHFRPYIPHFEALSFERLLPMVVDRGKSVRSMVSEVFMKQVRRLIYAKIYEDDAWQHRRISNFIYELRPDNLKERTRNKPLPPGLKTVSPLLAEAVETASSMGTTLWFTEVEKKDGMIDHLIACGRFSCCYNLLEYLVLLEKAPDYLQLPEAYRTDLTSLKQQLQKDWERFQLNPFWKLR